MTAANQSIQAEKIKSALTTTEFVLRGARSYLFVLASGAAALHTDEEDEQEVEAPCLIWTPVNQKARLSLTAGTRGFVLRIPETDLGRAIPTGSISGYVRDAISSRVLVPALPAQPLHKLSRIFEDIEAELFENDPGAQTVIQHCISLVLVHVWRTSNPTITHRELLPRKVVHDFFHLVELHLQSHWSVTQYAKQLGVSKDRLNSAVRRAIGTSPHRYIQGRLIDETKTLLLNSDLQIAEIAYKLGFNDAAYFNRFFQRHTAIPPGRFRNMHLPHAASEEARDSFAAWP